MKVDDFLDGQNQWYDSKHIFSIRKGRCYESKLLVGENAREWKITSKYSQQFLILEILWILWCFNVLTDSWKMTAYFWGI